MSRFTASEQSKRGDRVTVPVLCTLSNEALYLDHVLQKSWFKNYRADITLILVITKGHYFVNIVHGNSSQAFKRALLFPPFF